MENKKSPLLIYREKSPNYIPLKRLKQLLMKALPFVLHSTEKNLLVVIRSQHCLQAFGNAIQMRLLPRQISA